MTGKFSIQRFCDHVSGFFSIDENGVPTENFLSAEPLTETMIKLYYVPAWKEWYRNFGGSDKRLRSILRQDLIQLRIAGNEYRPDGAKKLVMLATTTFCKELARDGILLEDGQLRYEMNQIKHGNQSAGDIILNYYEEMGYQWAGMPVPPPEGKEIPTWDNLHDENGKVKDLKDMKVLSLFPNKKSYNCFIGSCYKEDNTPRSHQQIIRNYLKYRVQNDTTIKGGGSDGVREMLARFLRRYRLVDVCERTICRDFNSLLNENK